MICDYTNQRVQVIVQPVPQGGRTLSDRIVGAQKPIKVLSAINWDDEIKAKFFASGFKEQPEIDLDYWQSREIRLDPQATRDELRDIEAEISRQLGPVAPAGILMKSQDVVMSSPIQPSLARSRLPDSPLGGLAVFAVVVRALCASARGVAAHGSFAVASI